MAKYEYKLQGNFDDFLRYIDDGILKGSMSASLEDSSAYTGGNVRCAVRVYERYSWLGKNRVSMNVTLLGNGNELFVTAITSGGSQAVFMKINTWGEENFLDCIIRLIQNYPRA